VCVCVCVCVCVTTLVSTVRRGLVSYRCPGVPASRGPFGLDALPSTTFVLLSCRSPQAHRRIKPVWRLRQYAIPQPFVARHGSTTNAFGQNRSHDHEPLSSITSDQN